MTNGQSATDVAAALAPPDNTSPYDSCPYPDGLFDATQPEVLDMMARLHGLRPTDPRRARVLEIGCASGANLLPLAARYPRAEFVGVDLSRVQLDEARRQAAAHELRNVDLRCADLRDVDASWGTFDYVICHGVYSWVPADARDAILRICGSNLSEQGVAYVSYNTLPGWHFRQTIRDMMMFSAGDAGTTEQRVSRAKQWLKTIFNTMLNAPVDQIQGHAAAYAAVLQAELQNLDKCDDSYVRHEFLAENNQPVYFVDFMRAAAAAGLQYVCDSQLSSMFLESRDPSLAQAMQQNLSGFVEREQYFDFVRNRAFRRSILCRANVKVDRDFSLTAIRELSFASSLQRQQLRNDGRPQDADVALSNSSKAIFTIDDQRAIATADPIMQAALQELLLRWPERIEFRELVMLVQQRTGRSDPADEAKLATNLFRGLVARMLDAAAIPASCIRARSPRPEIWSYSRLQSVTTPLVATLRHRQLMLDEPGRELVRLLDGTRTVDELLAITNYSREELVNRLRGFAFQGLLANNVDDE